MRYMFAFLCWTFLIEAALAEPFEIPESGQFTIQIPTPTPLAVLADPADLGDMNDDGVLDGDDVPPFELALTLEADYEAMFPTILDYRDRGDITGNGVFDNFDMRAFAALIEAQNADIPEPGTCTLAALGFGLLLLGSRIKQRIAVA